MARVRVAAAVASRVACVLVPQVAVQALERADPDLVGRPLVVCEGLDVVDVSAAALELGLRVGMSLFAARAAAPDAVYRARSPELVRSAESALADLGAAFSPRVERVTTAGVALDVSELSRGLASDADAGNALVVAARKLGLAVRVGIARDKTTARIAARAGSGDGARSAITVVAPGREAAFLAPLPIALVEPEPSVLATLRGWGVRTIGELEALPQGGVAVGLGAEGARIARIARGQADAPLLVRPAPALSPAISPIFEEGIDLDWPCGDVQHLLSVLRRLLENLTARLACRGVAAGDLGLTLKLAPRGRDVRVVPVPSPTREVGPLLARLRAALATSPPAHAVDSIRVRTSAARARPAQLSFGAPAFACSPLRDKLASTLPDAFAMQPSNAPRASAAATPATRYAKGVHGEKGAHEADDALPARMTPAAADARQLALHALRPPLDAEARLDRGRLRYLSGPGVGGQVLAAAGPFRMRDGGRQAPTEDAAPPSIRDYYDVELSDGAIYRVFHDLQLDSWHIDGRYE